MITFRSVTGYVEATNKLGVNILVVPLSVTVDEGIVTVDVPDCLHGFTFTPLHGYDREVCEVIRERQARFSNDGCVITSTIGKNVFICEAVPMISAGQAAYEAYCSGDERRVAWDSLSTEDKDRWEDVGRCAIRTLVDKPILGRFNGDERVGKITNTNPYQFEALF